MTYESPYAKLAQSKWKDKTKELVNRHPLPAKEIVDVVLACWRSIFDSRIGANSFRIGEHIFPKPQIMGFFLHELIPLELAARHPSHWRVDESGADKDLVYLSDVQFSFEIKTSSHKSQIFGNRSYAQPSITSKKNKAGYYLTVNFEQFQKGTALPQIRAIRFGWLDHSDWVAQTASTGQQARLLPAVYETKLLLLYCPNLSVKNE